MEIKKLYSNNMQKSLTTCDLLVADTAKAITIVLWEDEIEQVEKDRCYFFKQVKLNCYNNKYLSFSTTFIFNLQLRHLTAGVSG